MMLCRDQYDAMSGPITGQDAFEKTAFIFTTNWITVPLYTRILYRVFLFCMLARRQYLEIPATGHIGTGFSWFPCV
jgi:hypothetical protein